MDKFSSQVDRLETVFWSVRIFPRSVYHIIKSRQGTTVANVVVVVLVPGKSQLYLKHLAYLDPTYT